MRQQISFFSLVALAVFGLQWFSLGCGRSNSQTGQGPLSSRDLHLLEVKRQDYEKRLKAMTVPQLAQELASDSRKGREPFNSPAYRELVSRGQAAAAELRSTLTGADRSSFLGLLALRQISPDQYRSINPALRVSALLDALKNAQYFNAWGIPHLYWEDAAKAVIGEGSAAEPGLKALLRDKRLAPVFGSEGAAINRQYRYRVCDYAWALLNAIEHQNVQIPADPAQRDHLIEQRLANQ